MAHAASLAPTPTSTSHSTFPLCVTRLSATTLVSLTLHANFALNSAVLAALASPKLSHLKKLRVAAPDIEFDHAGSEAIRALCVKGAIELADWMLEPGEYEGLQDWMWMTSPIEDM